jgi:small ligand-binding sensory domain FIST
MTAFRSALATGPDWRGVLAGAAQQLEAQDTAPTGLGIVYATEPMAPHFADIVATLKERTGIRHWTGCVGLGVCGTSGLDVGEYHDEGALSVLVTPWAADSFRVFDSLTTPDAVAPALNDAWVKANGPVFGFAHGDPRNRHVAAIVEALPQAGDGYFVGGLTALADTPVQVAGLPTGGGLSGAFVAAHVPVMVTHSQGCSPIGPMHRISSAERSIIAALDDRPALQVLKEDVGEVLARDLRRIGGYIHVAMPVPGSDTGDYTVRNLVGLDPDGGMIAVGDNVDIGDTIMFVRRDPETAQADFHARLADLKQRIGGQPIKGGVFVSCIARGANMFGEAGREARMISDVLGEFPLAGFYANGEICGNRMYGYTAVLSVFL